MKYNFVKEKPKSDIIGQVCKHAVYVVSKKNHLEDTVFVKITNVHSDGQRSQDWIRKDNYKRKFYIVKEKYRKFKQKKDYIDRRLLNEYTSTQARLAMTVSRILYGRNDPKADLQMMKNNEYLFGCESSVPVIVKRAYQDKYKEISEKEPATLAAYDVEADVVNYSFDDAPVMMASTTMKEVIYFCACRDWYDEETDEEIIQKLNEHAAALIAARLKRRNASVYWELVDNEGQVIYNNIQAWHQLQPDFVASWNSRYDMDANENGLKRYGYNLEQTYSHPGTPKEFLYYNFDKGRTHKRKENGDSQPLEWQEQFPTVRAAATWQWLDYASFYAIKNAPKGKKESYSLQFTAEDNGIDGKLYTEAGAHLPEGKGAWHKYMQRHHKYTYSIYNIVDNLVIEELAEKTNDIALNLPLLLKSSEFFDYPSQPRLISNELAFIAEQNGYIWGTKGRGKDEFDKYKPTLGNWIALLETEKNADLGVPIFNGMPGVRSRGRGLTDDIDVTGAYPTATVALNVSNKTTRMEACRIQGLNPLEFREVGVNYASSPKANAIGLCQTLHRFPGVEDIEKVYDELISKEANNLLAEIKK